MISALIGTLVDMISRNHEVIHLLHCVINLNITITADMLYSFNERVIITA